ncbi:MAG TPA: DUF1127 domain-containing protein [Roseomonas sp.]|jgi:uncharacterized protein YjiS (DUF1127 family)
MDARLTERELARLLRLPPANFRDAEEREAIRHAAVAARDAALVEGLRRTGRGIVAALNLVARTLVSWPVKRRTYAELLSLSDRELADIGLSRADVSRVFDPDFAQPQRGAKAPVALRSGRPLAA